MQSQLLELKRMPNARARRNDTIAILLVCYDSDYNIEETTSSGEYRRRKHIHNIRFSF